MVWNFWNFTELWNFFETYLAKSSLLEPFFWAQQHRFLANFCHPPGVFVRHASREMPLARKPAAKGKSLSPANDEGAVLGFGCAILTQPPARFRMV